VILEIDNLYAWYEKGKEILKGVNLNVGEGEIVSLIGPNGAGKTTLLNTIISIHSSCRGSIYICRPGMHGKNGAAIKRTT
jgi:ABC-type branched-chain amino acid transport systems, ATPase component